MHSRATKKRVKYESAMTSPRVNCLRSALLSCARATRSNNGRKPPIGLKNSGAEIPTQPMPRTQKGGGGDECNPSRRPVYAELVYPCKCGGVAVYYYTGSLAFILTHSTAGTTARLLRFRAGFSVSCVVQRGGACDVVAWRTLFGFVLGPRRL